ncbi:hypothetical protein BD311DRAFT_818963 [Dichomitus squalens]|uniref:RNase H type-1 domain-containing protein n=1 Tax=Dichomitus squalens TaxID=114155 RepID=A0A4Q9MWZ5_9APHY|nr:hypothetical protein BD311DRAFT_818963 [Dichomitus squalens]
MPDQRGEQCKSRGGCLWLNEGHPADRSIKLPSEIVQSNQTGKLVGTLVASQTIESTTGLTQETDSKLVLQTVTTRLRKNEDIGCIGKSNVGFTKAVVATLRRRKALVKFKWVKGHSGHPRNEGADRLAGLGALKSAPDQVDVQAPDDLRISGAKLQAMTQRMAYTAIMARKAANPRSGHRQSWR